MVMTTGNAHITGLLAPHKQWPDGPELREDLKRSIDRGMTECVVAAPAAPENFRGRQMVMLIFQHGGHSAPGRGLSGIRTH